MWHASFAPLPGLELSIETRRGAVLKALHGVGDASKGEWDGVGEIAYHVRRRLADNEEKLVGDICDVRGTHEAAVRLNAAFKYITSPQGRFIAIREARLR